MTKSGIGEFTQIIALTSTALTTAYTGANQRVALDTFGSESATFHVVYVNGGETSAQIQVEVWDSVQEWRIVLADEDLITAEYTSTADLNLSINTGILGRFETMVRISVKSTGGTPNSTTAMTVHTNLRSAKVPVRL